MITRERIEQIALMVLAALVLLVVSFYLILRPQWSKLQRVQRDTEQVTTELDKARAQVDLLPRLQEQCKTLEATVARQEAQFVGNGTFDVFWELVKRCADQTGLQLANVRRRGDGVTVLRGPVYAEQWVVLDTTAPYHVIGEWISSVERASPFVRIVSITVKGSDQVRGMHSAEVTLSFLTRSISP